MAQRLESPVDPASDQTAGNGFGLQATVEAELPDKSGSVDVLLEGASLRIAFEVAQRSPLEQELRNIVKSLNAGIAEIVVVSDAKTHLSRIREDASRQIDSEGMKRVAFIPFEEIGSYFASLGARLASPDLLCGQQPQEGIYVLLEPFSLGLADPVHLLLLQSNLDTKERSSLQQGIDLQPRNVGLLHPFIPHELE